MNNLNEALEAAKEIQIDNQAVGSVLISNINQLMSGDYSKEEARDLIFSDSDALDCQDDIEEGTLGWDQIRDFQNMLVNI